MAEEQRSVAARLRGTDWHLGGSLGKVTSLHYIHFLLNLPLHIHNIKDLSVEHGVPESKTASTTVIVHIY